MNTFACNSVNYGGEDIIKEFCDEQGQHHLEGKIVMSSTGFDCHHPIMSRDFQKTLDAEVYPEI
ncbi:hypothetical protein RZS08_37770, partial [Arthrospira platensis SPKY1]|nr:hypothetical protein [Arthrospira platensis SPKY1]